MIHKHNHMITISVIMINDNPIPLILNTPFETMVDFLGISTSLGP